MLMLPLLVVTRTAPSGPWSVTTPDVAADKRVGVDWTTNYQGA